MMPLEPSISGLSPAEMLQRVRSGSLSLTIEPQAAAQFVSARLLLPFVAVAVIGFGIALVFAGWIGLGLTVGLLGMLVPRLIKRSAVGFVQQQLAQDADFFADALRAGVITVTDVADRDAVLALHDLGTAASRPSTS